MTPRPAQISPGISAVELTIVSGGYVVCTRAGTPIAVFAESESLIGALRIWITERDEYVRRQNVVKLDG